MEEDQADSTSSDAGAEEVEEESEDDALVVTGKDAIQELKDMLDRLDGGSALSDVDLRRAKKLVKQCDTTTLVENGFGPPPRAALPKGLEKMAPALRLRTTQSYINTFQYNHARGYFYNINKRRPLCQIMNTARDIIKDSLPIKCIEAVFLGLFLTGSWHDLYRLPVGFKSKAAGRVYRHIVLLVYHKPTKQWGALGISRRPNLMDKPLKFKKLSDILTDYKEGYEMWHHTLLKVRVGLPAGHNLYCANELAWRTLHLGVSRANWPACCERLDDFASQMSSLVEKFRTCRINPVKEAFSAKQKSVPSGPARKRKNTLRPKRLTKLNKSSSAAVAAASLDEVAEAASASTAAMADTAQDTSTDLGSTLASVMSLDDLPMPSATGGDLDTEQHSPSPVAGEEPSDAASAANGGSGADEPDPDDGLAFDDSEASEEEEEDEDASYHAYTQAWCCSDSEEEFYVKRKERWDKAKEKREKKEKKEKSKTGKS